MLKDKLLSFLGLKKPIGFRRFKDPLGNFEIFFPRGWRFDQDIAVVDGKYTICFESGDMNVTISVDAKLEHGFDFKRYAKAELEGPTSGIIATMKRGQFRGMPAFKRSYSFRSGGKDFLGGGLMFTTGAAVFSLTWAAPERDRKGFMRILKHMIKTLEVSRGIKFGVAG